MRSFAILCTGAALVACAGHPSNKSESLDSARGKAPHSSAECLAQNLKESEPFPASAIPASALENRQSGWVAIRYDVLAGKAQNLEIVASVPPGLYDAAALQHAAKYRDPKGSTVRGCVMTIEVKF